ncbi:MAG: WD40/YVTN/BNR-like repeat-containing protein, partial [Candidatus Aminicenantales bacterium]
MKYQSGLVKRAIVFLAVVGMLFFCLCWAFQSYAQEITPDLYKVLRYRHIGPPGNRTAAVCGQPGNPLVYYVGASSGGIWKSTDGANTWFPIFDKQQALSIGALAVAPSDPNIIWAGTG